MQVEQGRWPSHLTFRWKQTTQEWPRVILFGWFICSPDVVWRPIGLEAENILMI
jgi:hypothetical protein